MFVIAPLGQWPCLPLRLLQPSPRGLHRGSRARVSSTSPACPPRALRQLEDRRGARPKGCSRVESERFTQLRSHYLFDAFFCLPGVEGAHEKGASKVRSAVFRRRHFVPLPSVASLVELQALVREGDDATTNATSRDDASAWASTSCSKRPTCARYLSNPSRVNSCCEHCVDTKSRVCVRQNFYSVPVTVMGRKVTVRLGANTVDLYDDAHLLATHDEPRARVAKCSSSTTTSRP